MVIDINHHTQRLRRIATDSFRNPSPSLHQPPETLNVPAPVWEGRQWADQKQHLSAEGQSSHSHLIYQPAHLFSLDSNPA